MHLESMLAPTNYNEFPKDPYPVALKALAYDPVFIVGKSLDVLNMGFRHICIVSRSSLIAEGLFAWFGTGIRFQQRF